MAKEPNGAVLFIRLTEADKRRFDRAAAAQRLGTSAWARMVLIDTVARADPPKTARRRVAPAPVAS